MLTVVRFQCGTITTIIPNTPDPACCECGSISHPAVEITVTEEMR